MPILKRSAFITGNSLDDAGGFENSIWRRLDSAISRGGYDAWASELDTDKNTLTCEEMHTSVLFNVHVGYDPGTDYWCVGPICDDGSEERLEQALADYPKQVAIDEKNEEIKERVIKEMNSAPFVKGAEILDPTFKDAIELMRNVNGHLEFLGVKAGDFASGEVLARIMLALQGKRADPPVQLCSECGHYHTHEQCPGPASYE